MSVQICQRCGKEIMSGGLFYRVRLVSQAGFDGVLNGDNSDDVDGIVTHIEGEDHEAMERDVYFELEAVLCINCKEIILENFQKEVGSKDTIGPGERLH